MSAERVLVAPHNGAQRYPPYAERAGAARVHAYLLEPGELPAGAALSNLVVHLARGTSAGPTRTELLAHRRAQELVDRSLIVNWDVWIVRDR